jgi:hypothetical protein
LPPDEIGLSLNTKSSVYCDNPIIALLACSIDVGISTPNNSLTFAAKASIPPVSNAPLRAHYYP